MPLLTAFYAQRVCPARREGFRSQSVAVEPHLLQKPLASLLVSNLEDYRCLPPGSEPFRQMFPITSLGASVVSRMGEPPPSFSASNSSESAYSLIVPVQRIRDQDLLLGPPLVRSDIYDGVVRFPRRFDQLLEVQQHSR
jgi:hypothetical protein